MDHRLRIDLLDVPEVSCVVWTEESMRGTLAPAVETDFKRAHEVLPREHRVFLVPDNPLAEVQLVLLQERRIVPQVGVPAPDVETMARHQHSGDVAKPGV